MTLVIMLHMTLIRSKS